MKYNFQKAKKIYIPYVPDNELKSFLTGNFEIPNNNIEEIITFIEKSNIQKLVFNLPNIIGKEFINDRLLLDLYIDEWDIDTYLEISILTSFNGEISAIKENILFDVIIDKFNTDMLKPIIFKMVYNHENIK